MKYVEKDLEVELVKDSDGNYIQFEWRDVVGYEGYYQVSNYGHVKSLQRVIVRSDLRFRTYPEKIRQLTPSNSGYLSVGLCVSKEVFNAFVHRLVAEAFVPKFTQDMEVDHIDTNKMNNIVCNLRPATSAQNKANSNKRDSISKYKGVKKGSVDNSWQARIQVDGEVKYLGQFTNEENAALAYNQAALKYFGEFALLNDLDITEFTPEIDKVKVKNICIDTGKVYSSWKEAAEDIGVDPSNLSKAYRLGKRIKGLLFTIVD